ncbi:hypothetical protein CERSUDRAFT_126170 [Gelatoporia subvermispora B]|uniref:Uncharacterized protein n=1 Tax=Ceriporiopsis subvermispora (strain B) TaxID=914234 RepID=M2R5M7_CERS8|nr:hypothetical protein CERSUDRAFT_126170 [Gelatoporia subvermispora B]
MFDDRLARMSAVNDKRARQRDTHRNKSIRGATSPPTWLQIPGTRPAGTINLSSGGAAQSVNGLGEIVGLARRVPIDDTDNAHGGLLYQPIVSAYVVQRVYWMPEMRQTAWNEPLLRMRTAWRRARLGMEKILGKTSDVMRNAYEAEDVPYLREPGIIQSGTANVVKRYLDDRRRSVRGGRTQLADSLTDYNQDLRNAHMVQNVITHPKSTAAGVPAPIGIVALVESDDCVASRYGSRQWQILNVMHKTFDLVWLPLIKSYEKSNFLQLKCDIPDDSDVQKHRNWLTPPDPSINHNLALRSYSKGTSAWFIDGQVMGEWKTTSSLLWIHGKPGSGKTILCTAIIENIRRLCLIQEKSNLAYFYCNFQDAKKQSARGLLSHLLIHFSAASHACSQLLSGLWSSHSNGSHQPSEHDLRQCLKSVIALLADHCLYIVIDALDECPDSSIHSHSQRRDVLMLIREIVDWGFHNVHRCVTSRPEQDIREAMEALSPRSISLHTESGQMDEISSYVHSVIESDRAFRRWKASDRELAVQHLREKANGMFRWVFCQLEMLRGCHPATIRKVLDDLPKTLDETYRRVLQTLDTPGWEYTHRLFECLIVCARPLRVDELADVLAIDFNSGPIPQFFTDWRPSDPEGDILAFCSSMIVIDLKTKTVQFAHFSVQEYFLSERLASDLESNVKKFHIVEEHAHTTMAKACLGILLQLDNKTIMNYSAARDEPPLGTYRQTSKKSWNTHLIPENLII